jgi:riboflavin kinase/FMN adenylyltransferase
MKIIRTFEELQAIKKEPCAIALGTFDGIHLGHQDVIKTAISFVGKQALKSMVFTFSNHPMSSIMPELVPPQLIDNKTKEQLLESMGVDILVNIPFTRHIADISPDDFMTLLERIGAKVVVVGKNYSYGAGGTANSGTMKAEGPKYGIHVVIRTLLALHGLTISSTQIRKAIADGDLEYAHAMLGRPYSLSGCVIHGDARGRTMGFPTANLDLTNSTFAIPKSGVYAGIVSTEGKRYEALVNVGSNPTFGANDMRLEAHLLDFDGDLYGKTITAELYSFVRGEKAFENVEALKKQIMADEKQIRNFFEDVVF